MKITYEVHALSKGRWNIESMYKGNQREQAVEDAKRLNREPHIEAVKVVCETYNEQTNQSSEVVIFDTARPQDDKPRRPPPKPRPDKGNKQSDVPLTVRHQKKKKSGMSGTTTALLVVALIVALGVLYLMTAYSDEISRWLG